LFCACIIVDEMIKRSISLNFFMMAFVV